MKNGYRNLLFGFLGLMMLLVSGTMKVQAQTTGGETKEFSNLVVFVQFSDTEDNFMSDSAKVKNIQKYYNDENYTKSLVSYMKAISYGQFHVTTYMPQYDQATNTITPITLSKERAYYAMPQTGFDGEYAAMSEALRLLATGGYDWSKWNLDRDGDGAIDNVTFIFQGDGGERLSVFYPKKQDYNGTEKINNKRISAVNTLNEEALFDVGSIQKQGVICHEFMHSIGYPDLYKEGTSATPVGRWDLMASSSLFLQYPLAYMRSSVSNWLTIKEITSKTTNKHVELVPASNPNGNQAYILRVPELSDTEFFVIEYRKQGKAYSDELDTKIPGTGMIVYRINTAIQDLSNHYGTEDGVYVFRPGETNITAATAGNLNQSFYSKESGRTTVGSTDFSSTIKDGALVFSDGTNSGIKITNIGNAGDTISCDIEFGDTSKLETWNYDGDTPRISNEDSSEISMDVDEYGNAYVLHTINYNQLAVTKCEKSTGKKTILGSTLNDYDGNGIVRIWNGTPYVIFSNFSLPSTLRIYKYDAGVWENVTTHRSSGSGETYIQYLSAVAGTDGIYIVYEDGTSSDDYELKLGKYDPSSKWTDLCNFGVVNGTSPDITLDDEKVYISYRHNLSSGNKPEVVYYDLKDNAYGALGNLSQVRGDSGVRIAAEKGVICLLVDDSNGMKIYQYKPDTDWKAIGTGELTTKSSPTVDIAILKGCPIVVLVHQEEEAANTQVFRYRGGVWTQEGPTLDTSMTNGAELATWKNKIFLAYLNTQGEETFPVMKWREILVQTDDTLHSGDGSAVTTPTQPTKPTVTPKPKDPLNGKTFVIYSRVGSKKVLEIKGASKKNGANIQINKYKKSKGQKFKITYVGNGYYKITNVKSKKVLEVKGNSKKNGANVRQGKWKKKKGQLWKIKKQKDGTYTIQSKLGKMLTVKGGKNKNGTNVQMNKKSGKKSQKWRLG